MNLTLPAGLLIAVDGIDGAGKTTLAHALGAALGESGVPVTVSKEPTAGPWGMKLRTSALHGRLSVHDELKYLVLDRRQHVEELIAPSLERGEIVILDRYFPSTVAYQGAAGLPVDELMDANAFAPRPDLLALLDVDPAIGLARIRSRGDMPNYFETLDNLERCREIFLSLGDLPYARVVDASKSPSEVFNEVFAQALLLVADKLRVAKGLSAESIEAMVPFLGRLTG